MNRIVNGIECLYGVPTDGLPEEIRVADPSYALTAEERTAYMPVAHASLNMLKIGLWFTLSIGLLGLLYSLVIDRSRTVFFGIVLVLCAAGLFLTYRRYALHAKAGGDAERRGTYLLGQGVLVIRRDKTGRSADFIPRDAIAGFSGNEDAEQYADMMIGIVLKDGTAGGPEFPSVGMLQGWHKDCLTRWLETGRFDWNEYKKPPNPEDEQS